MKQINPKGEVFILMPDGSVCKKVNSFREIFEAYEDTKSDGTVAIEIEVAEARRIRNQKREERLARIDTIKAYAVSALFFSVLSIVIAVFR